VARRTISKKKIDDDKFKWQLPTYYPQQQEQQDQRQLAAEEAESIA
jgi:hypothetical protein